MDPDKGGVWTNERTQFIIERFKAHFKDLISKKISSKKVLWQIISNEFEKKGDKLTPSQCQNRWKSIIRFYRKYACDGVAPKCIEPFLEDLSYILTNPTLGYNISIGNIQRKKKRKLLESDDEDDTDNDDDDDDDNDDDDDYVADDKDDDENQKNVSRRKSPRTIKPESSEFTMEFENVFPESFVETTSAEDFINMNFVNTNGTGQATAAVTAKPVNVTNNFISNDTKNKNSNINEPSSSASSKIAMENLKNSKETTMILKKLTIEILKNSKRKSIMHQKKLQLMAERNRILKSIKLSEPESSVSAINAVINNQQEFHTDDIEYTGTINEESDKTQVQQWLMYNNLISYNKVFQFFRGTDILKLNKDDLIKICGISDGIRMYNLLHVKRFESNLKIYISLNGGQFYNIINLIEITIKEFLLKLIKIKEFYAIVTKHYSHVSAAELMNVLNNDDDDDNSIAVLGLSFYLYGPNNIQIILTKDVLASIKNDSSYIMEFHTDGKIFLRTSLHNEQNV